ncbi:hypothetical protein FRC04_010817 [Tulasnella sp. 424]|nr:hypothetical protein FRC04_010817 [Tulasnella sp. 424]
MQTCASCSLAADPSQAMNLQMMLTEYETGCQNNGRPVGTLTLTGTGVTAALASATESMASAASSRSVAAASRSAASASATPGSTKNGSGAAFGGVRTGSALLAAGISVALVFL